MRRRPCHPCLTRPTSSTNTGTARISAASGGASVTGVTPVATLATGTARGDGIPAPTADPTSTAGTTDSGDHASTTSGAAFAAGPATDELPISAGSGPAGATDTAVTGCAAIATNTAVAAAGSSRSVRVTRSVVPGTTVATVAAVGGR